MTTIYLSLGSNIEAEHNIKQCVHALCEHFGNIICSNVYQTPAIGFEGDDFLNLVVQLESNQSLETIKQICRDLEDQQGRVRQDNKFSARPIDIDVLLYGEVVDTVQKIPHGDLEKYDFVTLPLLELAPDNIHPLQQRPLSEIAAEKDFKYDDMCLVNLGNF